MIEKKMGMGKRDEEKKDKTWIKYLLGFGHIWECHQCGTINREGRWYCGLCGKKVEKKDKVVM